MPRVSNRHQTGRRPSRVALRATAVYARSTERRPSEVALAGDVLDLALGHCEAQTVRLEGPVAERNERERDGEQSGTLQDAKPERECLFGMVTASKRKGARKAAASRLRLTAIAVR